MPSPFACFNSDVVPREPFSKELTTLPPRSRYIAVFIATWTFTGSVLLIKSVRYATTGSWLRAAIPSWLQIGLELCIVVLPFEMCMIDYPVQDYRIVVCIFNLICFTCATAAVLHRTLRHPMQKLQLQLPSEEISSGNGTAFNDIASLFRSIVYISTALCVFARDLPCWRNEFSKTYSFGNGVMDVGLGCFIICIGMLGPSAGKLVEHVDAEQAIQKSRQMSLFLLICGLVRAVIKTAKNNMQGMQFETEILEYGAHWNAFISLSVAKLAGTWLELRVLPNRMSPLLAAAVLWLIQELLLFNWLAAAVLAPGKSEPYNRSNLIGQNREGLSSVLGIVPLYLAGLQIGRWCSCWCKQRNLKSLLSLTLRLLVLLIASLGYRMLQCQLPWLLLPESRRLFNMSYCVWIIAFTSFCLLNCCLLAYVHLMLQLQGQLSSNHMLQIDRASMIYFIVSQLLTGIGNGMVSLAYPWREKMPGVWCFTALLLYMIATFVIAVSISARVQLSQIISIVMSVGKSAQTRLDTQ